MTFDSLRSASSNTKRRRPINTMLENFGHKVPMEIHETNTEASQTTQVATCVADQDCSLAGSDCDENTKSRPKGAEQRDDSTDPTVTSQAEGSDTGNSPVYTKVNLESRKSHVTASAGSEEVSVYHKLDYVTGDVATSRVSFVRKSPGPERNKSVDYFHEVLLRWGPKLPEDGDYDHLDSDFSGRFRITHKLRRPTDVNGKSPEEEHKSKPTVKSRSLFNVGNSNKKEKPRLKKTTI
uniref:uncharacterized protein LOC113474419 n=2 Tax=Ciona intestinalis TaxID=7719 RepID=UPI000EF4737B|nr:uncharacterized protein LOC113474419 [Ciona intestinalis]|eukprot:XP_026691253.1 uncharacterized protein LOC113474419 [Ciona intestinalis]